MTSNQRSPLWPYMLVLGSLFALSLAVPHGWQSESDPPRTDDWQPVRKAPAHSKHSLPPVAIVRPSADLDAVPMPPAGLMESAQAQSRQNLDGVFSTHPSSDGVAVTESLVERVAQKITSSRIFGVAQNLWSNFDPTTGSAKSFNPLAGSGTNRSAVEDDGFRSVPAPNATIDNQLLTGPGLPTPANPLQHSADTIDANNCVVPRGLLDQIDRVAQSPECVIWAANAKGLCAELCRTSPGDAIRSVDIVRQLQTLVPCADQLADQLKDAQPAENLRRARYALQRRLLVWGVLFSDGRQSVYANVISGDEKRRRLNEALAAADAHLRTVEYADGWRNYLLLNDVARLADADQQLSPDEARQIARQTIQRLSPRQASDAQRQLLSDTTLISLAEQLRSWAFEAVDLREVLSAMEYYESTGLPSDGRTFVTLVQRLNWSPAERDRQLAQDLDLHYRNANIRIAISGDLINRLAPDPAPATGIVNDTILNARVSGSSQTKAELQVKLIPDPARLHLWVAAQGSVDSVTQSTRGPATFNNRGETTFAVRKGVILDDHGYTTENATAEANSKTQLLGVQTTLDGKPVLGSIARRYATTKEEALRGEANHEVDQKVAAQAEERLNGEVDRRLKLVNLTMREELLAPLTKLGLDPDPIALQTTAQRLTARLRLAGQAQAGGHTARPQAPSDSLASLQLHESAIDNMLDRLELAGRTFTLPELFQYVADRVSQPWDVPADLPSDAVVTFAKNDPIRVRCQDGTVRLTLVISELRRGARQWRDFAVTVGYQPQIDGLHVRLVRSGVVELSGDAKGQTDLLLRGIFSKLLPSERRIDLIPTMLADQPQLADLAITQCVIADGWIGLALGPDRGTSSGNIALRK